jgi:hypothetical protein
MVDSFPLIGVPQPDVQHRFDPMTLSSDWSLCYKATYDVALNSTVLDYILATCFKEKLLLGCRPVSSSLLTLAAMGLREHVFFDCGKQKNCVHVDNGVGWYFSNNLSWGFVQGGDSVNRDSCDTGMFPCLSIAHASTDISDLSTTSIQSSQSRLCWNTGSNAGGYRCGSHVALDNDSSFMRVIYHAD